MTEATGDADDVARPGEQGGGDAPRRRFSARRGLRAGLLVLGCLLALIATVTVWARVVLLDTDGYVDTVAPLAQQPAVQDGIAQRLGDRVTGAVDLEAYAAEVLPPRAQPLAAPIANGIEQFVRREISDFVRSDDFGRLWDEANRRAHALVIQLLTGEEVRGLRLEGDTVVLDLGGVIDAVKQRLSDRGLDRIAARIPSDAGRDVPLVQSSALGTAQDAIRVLKGVAILLPILSLLAFVGYVLLSDDRRRAILRAALALTATFVVLLGLIGIGRSAYLDALSSRELSKGSSAEVFDTIVRYLKDGLRIAVGVTVVVALLAALLGRPMDRLATAGAARRGREADWVRRHRAALQIGVAALGALVLLSWNTPGAGVVLLLFALVAIAIGLIAALSRAPAAAA